jgi:cell division protein FtsI/penicillin-binding protein 2
MKVTAKIHKLTLFLYRCFIVFAIYCIGFALSVIFDSDLRKAEKEVRSKIIKSESSRRGNILSSEGKPLAAYDPEYTLYADFGVRIDNRYTIDNKKVTTKKKGVNPVKLDTFRLNIYKELAESLSKTMGGNTNSYYRDLYNYRIKAEDAKKNGKTGNKEWFTENILKRKIDIFHRDKIIENPYLKKRGRNITGIYAEETGTRTFPFGKNFAHSAIGSVSEKTVSGIENMYNAELEDGDDILTTIDTRMQDICETVLQNKISSDKQFVGGAIILMEVSTGDIKAMANIGEYDKERHNDIRDIFNNATKATIEPGSTFKTVSLMLALETKKIKLSDKFNTKVWRDKKNVEKNNDDTFLTVSQIIEQSSNIGAGNMADKAFKGDVNEFIKAIKALKIIDKIEDMDETRPSINPNNNRASILNIAFGYQIQMAPIHILSFYNAIANNGVMMKPRLVRGMIDRRTGKTKIFNPEVINNSICSKNTLDSVRLTLSRVVERGSALRIAESPYGIVGKTGTAKIWLENVKGYETANGLSRDLSSFCGYFPQKNPKYSCIIVLYTKLLTKSEMDNFYASSTAVPLFRKVSDKIYALHFDRNSLPAGPTCIPSIKNTGGKSLSIIAKQLDLPVSVDSDTWFRVDTVNQKLQLSEISLKKGIVPDVTGMGLRDAMFLLENTGLKVSYSGIGTVIKQSPEQGVPYRTGQRIYLTLDTSGKPVPTDI